VSYAFDERAGIDFFNMAIHVPGILPWGDVSVAAALSGKNILFIDPVSMSGRPLDDRSLAQCKSAFIKMRSVCKTSGKTTFRWSVLSTDHSTIHKTVHHE